MGKMKNGGVVAVAVVVAIVMPLLLSNLIYPAFQVFLPSGNIVLTPTLRVIATILMSVVDYGIAYIFIYQTLKRKKILFNTVCFALTFLLCVFWGYLWYIDL